MLKCFDRKTYEFCKDTATGETFKRPKGGPSLLQKAVNFTAAAAKHAATGQRNVELPVIQQRLEICQNCPSDNFVILDPEGLPNTLKVAGEVGTCNHRTCGCFIHGTTTFPNKLAWASQACPLGHWGAE